MNFDFDHEQQAFLKEVITVLDENVDPEVFVVTRENMAQIVDTPPRRAFMGKLAKQGWLGITWPKELGGKDGEGVYEYLLNEQLATVAPGIGGPPSARGSLQARKPAMAR